MERKSRHDRTNSGVSWFLHKALNISQDKKTDIPKTTTKRVSAPNSSKLAFIKSKFQPLPNFNLSDEPTHDNEMPVTKAIKRHHKNKTPESKKFLRRPPKVPTLELTQEVVNHEYENEECKLRRGSDNSAATNDEACMTTRRIDIKDSSSEETCGTMRIVSPGNLSGKQIAASSSGEVTIPMKDHVAPKEKATVGQGAEQHNEIPDLSPEDVALAKELAKELDKSQQAKIRPPIPKIYLLNKKYSPLHEGQVDSLAYIVHAYEAFKDTPDHFVTEHMMNAITDHLNQGNYAENYKRWHETFNEKSAAFCKGNSNLQSVTRPALRWFAEHFSPPK